MDCSVELAGLAEIADILGVSKRSATRYTMRADFPSPIARLRAGPIWLKDDVKQWGQQHLPIAPGRPRAQRKPKDG